MNEPHCLQGKPISDGVALKLRMSFQTRNKVKFKSVRSGKHAVVPDLDQCDQDSHLQSVAADITMASNL